MENRFVFNADAEKAQIQSIFDDVMNEIEHSLKQGNRKTFIRVPNQHGSEIRQMIESILFVGNHRFGWKTYSSSGNKATISETWNGIREYTLCYYGD